MSGPAYRIHCSDQMSDGERASWEARLAARDFGEVAVRWCQALQQSRPPGFELHYLRVHAGEEPKALVVLHLLRRFDLSGYIGGTISRVFGWLAQLGIRPLTTDLAFLELPLSNLSGILLTRGAEGEALAIATAVREFVRREFEYGILCLKGSPSAVGEEDYGALGMLETEFLANMTVELKGEATLDEYVKRLSPRVRNQCRAYRKQFERAGGAIEEVSTFEPRHFEEMARLYESTCARHQALGEVAVPIPIGRDYFEALSLLSEPSRRVLFARVNGQAVAFAILVRSGDALYFTHCGMDYDRSIPVRGYFNLNYAIFERAIALGVKTLEMGAQAYEFKKKMGAVAVPTRYYFEVTNPVLAFVSRRVAKHFAAQDGSRQVDAA